MYESRRHYTEKAMPYTEEAVLCGSISMISLTRQITLVGNNDESSSGEVRAGGIVAGEVHVLCLQIFD